MSISDETFRALERELFSAHEGTADLAAMTGRESQRA